MCKLSIPKMIYDLFYLNLLYVYGFLISNLANLNNYSYKTRLVIFIIGFLWISVCYLLGNILREVKE